MDINAEELMTADVVTVSEETTLAGALAVMQEKGIRHLPVVRGERLVGMLSDRDLQSLGLRLVVDIESLERLESKLNADVGSVMSTELITITSVTDVNEIIDLLVEEQVGAIPVVEGENLIGIVSYVDVLRAVREQLD
ncbi:MAG: CBS domain-containing protein [Sandaracinaceae bacterium]|nr:CBS domain-containing protein [Sandaracinaceae bacterium]